MDDLVQTNSNNVVDEERASTPDEESLEELISRAEDQIKNVIERIPSNSQNSIISGYIAESYVSSTLSQAQAVLDSIQTMSTAMPRSSSSSDNNPIVIDSDDDDVMVVSSNIPIVVDLCSPTIPIRVRALPNNNSSTNGNSNASHENCNQQNSEKSNGIPCPICMESSLVQPHSTKCGHLFCGACITKSLKIVKKCPMCNKVLKLNDIHPVFI